jgi:DNA-binding PadR family transcriptional regulator
MSPVFRHGRLRLYLLKLLDDAPKHGYEVIRLLQDRFMGVYAPSPGTIYPRLARLEEEGLVTHDEVDGRKVYRLTEKGREEIRDRMDDLAELEREITESVRDIAREVKEDVRQTVRSLREEIAWAARDASRQQAGQPEARPPRGQAQRASEEAPREGEAARPRQARQEPDDDAAGAHGWDEESRRAGEEAGRPGDEARRFRAGRGGARKDWGDWPGWRDWAGWQEWPGWRERPGQHDWPGGRHPPGWPDAASRRDLERMAIAFISDLRRLASHASAIGEDALGDLRTILDEALTRIRNEVFQPESGRGQQPGRGQPGEAPVPPGEAPVPPGEAPVPPDDAS